MNIKLDEIIDNNLELSSYANPLPGKSSIHVRKFILEASRKQSNTSMIYKDTLKTILLIFGQLTYLNSDDEVVKVKCIHANPERTIAKLNQENNIILPILSVNQTISEDDPNRSRFSNMIVQESLWDEEKRRAFRVVSLVPKATNITYSINIWSKYKSDMDQLVEQIRSEFHPSKTISTRFNTQTKAFLTREDDIGSFEAVEREDRILKKAFSISVETYIPPPKFLLTSSGKIESFNTEIYPVSGSC